MAGYCTPAELIASFNESRLAELSADAGPTPDTTVIQGAIDFASGRIDSYLLGRYVTPVTQPPSVMGVLKNHCITLAIFRLFQDRLVAESYKTFVDDVSATVAWLKDIGAGKLDLPSAAAVSVNVTAQVPTFSGSEAAVYMADSNGVPIIL